MRVYRIISAREITSIYQGQPKRMALVKGDNTHKYEKDTSYIHFFRYYESAENYFKQYRPAMNSLDRYIAYMVANIPNNILKQRIGYGFYHLEEEPFNRYIVPVPEYAIKEDEMKHEYIVEINDFISSNYKKENSEYKQYLDLIKVLAKKYDYNFDNIANYLQKSNLEELLGVHDDERTESEILNDKIKQLCKVFPLYD